MSNIYTSNKPNKPGFWWALSENGRLSVKEIYSKNDELWAGSVKLTSFLFDKYMWSKTPIDAPER